MPFKSELEWVELENRESGLFRYQANGNWRKTMSGGKLSPRILLLTMEEDEEAASFLCQGDERDLRHCITKQFSCDLETGNFLFLLLLYWIFKLFSALGEKWSGHVKVEMKFGSCTWEISGSGCARMSGCNVGRFPMRGWHSPFLFFVFLMDWLRVEWRERVTSRAVTYYYEVELDAGFERNLDQFECAIRCF